MEYKVKHIEKKKIKIFFFRFPVGFIAQGIQFEQCREWSTVERINDQELVYYKLNLLYKDNDFYLSEFPMS